MVVIHYFGENVTEFGRLEKLSRMECHNVTNLHFSINFEKKNPLGQNVTLKVGLN
jgi:hypothetical protein